MLKFNYKFQLIQYEKYRKYGSVRLRDIGTITEMLLLNY
jgi:hypothetical protein